MDVHVLPEALCQQQQSDKPSVLIESSFDMDFRTSKRL